MSAPLLVRNAVLWSGTRLGSGALFARDGRIVAVGPDAERAARGHEPREVDAAGATLTPGLTDAHLHFVPWARARRQPELAGAASRAEALARVARALAALPPGREPLVGRGWDESTWSEPPALAALDALAPDRPVLLHRHDFHALWVNTAALRAAGISNATPDPDGGAFVRDAAGALTGLAREAAVRVFEPLEAAAAPAVDEALLDEAAAALHALGVTTVHDYQRNATDWARMRALAGRGRLRVLQHVGPDQVRAAAATGLVAGAGDAWFRTGSLKLFADGTLGSRTAAMLAPWDDTPGTGMALYTREALTAEVAMAASAGFSVTIHAIGDAAVRVSLDAIEANSAALGPLALPPRIEHVQLLHADDLPRFAALGVAASMQPQHATTDAPVARRAWGTRCARSYPWRDLLASGARLAFGSDAPVEPPVAALGLAAACARLAADGSPFTPEQCLPLDAALHAYTAGAAALAAGRLGSGRLEPGAMADLVVWDRDLHAAPGAALGSARPVLTALGGEIVYDSRSSASPSGLR